VIAHLQASFCVHFHIHLHRKGQFPTKQVTHPLALQQSSAPASVCYRRSGTFSVTALLCCRSRPWSSCYRGTHNQNSERGVCGRPSAFHYANHMSHAAFRQSLACVRIFHEPDPITPCPHYAPAVPRRLASGLRHSSTSTGALGLLSSRSSLLVQ
jgi:hypothetical protein